MRLLYILLCCTLLPLVSSIDAPKRALKPNLIPPAATRTIIGRANRYQHCIKKIDANNNNNNNHKLAFLSSHQLLCTLRGGDGEQGKSSLVEQITPAKVLAYSTATLLAAFTVALVRKIPRSGGRGPAWLTSRFIPEPFATVALHLGYFLHCLVVLKLVPVGLRNVIFSPTGVILLGTLFPVVESIRAAATFETATTTTSTSSTSHQRIWLQYWIMHGLFSYSTEFVDKLADRYPFVHRHWYAMEFYLFLWLLLPMTDGATVMYHLVTKPYLVPIFKPISEICEGWLTTLALTMVNASYMWWFSVVFLALPNVIKRLAVMFTGTVFPIIATVMAVATMKDNDGADMKWLTYWSCFSLLHLTMTTVEKLTGPITGLYTIALASTLYLMLPLFNGSTKVFREVLVPLFGQREALILKDAKILAKELVKKLPKDRHGAARKAVAAAFLEDLAAAAQ